MKNILAMAALLGMAGMTHASEFTDLAVKAATLKSAIEPAVPGEALSVPVGNGDTDVAPHVKAYCTIPDGIAGVRWGAAREEVRQVMLSKGFREVGNSSSPDLIFAGIFSNRQSQILFSFKGNKFYSGRIFEKSFSIQDVFRAYDYYLPRLTEKYGNPDKIDSNYSDSGSLMGRTAGWEIVAPGSADKYKIDAYGGFVGIYDMSSGRDIYMFYVEYEAVTFGQNFAEDEV